MENSILFQKADTLAFETYKASKEFPKEELRGITSQLRRAVLSVPLNITEGYGRQSPNDYRCFLEIVYGSLRETKYLLSFAKRENFLEESQYTTLMNLSEEVSKMLWSAIKTIRNR